MNEKMNTTNISKFEIIEPLRSLLGIRSPVALTCEEMIRSLQVTFFPYNSCNERVTVFTDALKETFAELGVRVLPFETLLKRGRRLRIPKGVVMVAAGESVNGRLPIDYASSLYENPILGIFDSPCPVGHSHTSQERLDGLMSVFAWHMVHNAIFLDGNIWALGTSNGAIASFSFSESFTQAVRGTLIPRIAAGIIPPRDHQLVVRTRKFDPSSPETEAVVNEFTEAGKQWAQRGGMLAHTPVSSLSFRSNRYRRLGSLYLDGRTGISFGFLAWQLPIRDCSKSHQEAEFRFALPFGSADLILPDIQVIGIRSGCDKTRLDPETDLVRLTLSNGRIIFDLPPGAKRLPDCRPSYDTLTILSHALGNALIAQLNQHFGCAGPLEEKVRSTGTGITHWHGYPAHEVCPQGFRIHGEDRPPVACSTPQSALFGILGKLESYVNVREAGTELAGDLHIEPLHGTNLSGLPLSEAAKWAVRE